MSIETPIQSRRWPSSCAFCALAVLLLSSMACFAEWIDETGHMHDWTCDKDGSLIFIQDGWTTNGCTPGCVRMYGTEYALHEYRIQYGSWAFNGHWQNGTLFQYNSGSTGDGDLYGSQTYGAYWYLHTNNVFYSEEVPIGGAGAAVVDLGDFNGTNRIWIAPYSDTVNVWNADPDESLFTPCPPGEVSYGPADQGSPNADSTVADQGDDINAINGNVSIVEDDLFIPCAGIPLEFRRRHDSAREYDSPLGAHWTHSYLWQMSETSRVYQTTGRTNNWRCFLTDMGEEVWFPLRTNGQYDMPQGKGWRLEATNDTYRLTMPERLVYEFDTNGILQSLRDGFSNTVSLTYSNGLLLEAQHSDGRALEFTYESNQLVRVDTPSSNLYVAFSYNAAGELTGAVHSVSGTIRAAAYEYDTSSNHCVLQKTDARGYTNLWAYETNSLGGFTRTGSWYRLATNYFETAMAYSATALQTTVTTTRDDTNLVRRFVYDPAKQRVVRIEGPDGPSNPVIRRVFDSAGFLTRWDMGDTMLGETGCAVFVYDAEHNLTNFAYGLRTTDLNDKWILKWNAEDKTVSEVKDPEAIRTTVEYTNAAPTRVRVYLTAYTTLDTYYAWTSNGLLSAVTNADGDWVRYVHDSYGYPTSVVPVAGPETWLSWDSLGHLREIRLPSDEESTNYPPEMVPRVIGLDTDEQGWLRQITWPDAIADTFTRDALGNVTNHVDRLGRSTRYGWLPTRGLSSVTRTLNGQDVGVQMAYDKQMNVLRVTDELGRNVETYELDAQDRPVQVTNIESQEMTVVYGLGDYVRSVTRFDGTMASNSIDSSGRVWRTEFPGDTNLYAWRRNGQLLRAANAAGVVSNSYDGAGRMISVTNAAPGGLVNYGYSAAGLVTNVSSVAGNVRWQYDAGRLARIVSGAGTFSNGYNHLNGLLSAVTGPVLRVEYGYDLLDRLTSITWRDRSNQVLRSFAYARDAVSRITSVDYETGERVEYANDSLDRLAGETHYNDQEEVISEETWDYDLAGNRTNKVANDIPVAYTLGTGNRLSGWHVTVTGLVGSVDVVGCANENVGTNNRFGALWVSNTTAVTPFVEGTNFWAYGVEVQLGSQKIVAAVRDMAGNTVYVTNEVFLTVITNGSYLYNSAGCVTNIAYAGVEVSENIGLTWNSQYQLTAVSTNGVECERNGYDALGRRVWNWDGATTNYFVCDDQQIVADVDSTGGVRRTYVWGPGIDNLLAMTVHTGATAKTYFVLTDHLGTVHALADTNGVIVESYRFDAWGRVLGVYDGSGQPIAESAIGNRYLWQGREYSWKTGLYFFRSRWYDPVSARWLSPDPIGISGGLNQYVFCVDNPVNCRDPFGLCGNEEPPFLTVWGNTINNRVTAVNMAFGANLANLYNWLASRVGAEDRVDFNSQYVKIVNLANSTATPANPEATPYIVGALGVSAAAATTAAVAGGVEMATGLRVELHGTHGWTTPHLQGIEGNPGVGPYARGITRWRWPSH